MSAPQPSTLPWLHPERVEKLYAALSRRILVIDGAMGTMLQSYELDESGFRGERFTDGRDSQHTHAAGDGHGCDLKGDNDLLTLTQPADHQRVSTTAYLEAGADSLETNTFNATAISQSDYSWSTVAYDINRDGAPPGACCMAADQPRLTPTAALRHRARSDPPAAPRRFRRMSTIPAARNVEFRRTGARPMPRQHEGLIEGGADLFMVETIFDTLNAKAALFAIDERVRAPRCTPADDDLGHDHRPLGPHAVRARRPKRSGTRCAMRNRCRSA